MTLFDETAADLIRRQRHPTLKTGIEPIDGQSGLFPGQVVEIAGPSGVGKTQLLKRIALQCILPRRLGGIEQVAVYLDLDGKFDPHQFFPVLEQRLKRGGWLDVEEAKKGCLSRLLYVRCRSSYEVLSVLKTLPQILANRQLPAKLGCVLVDNIMAYCWSDKANEPLKSEGVVQPWTFAKVQECVFAEFEKLLRTFRVAIVISKHTTTTVRLGLGDQLHWDQKELVQHRLQKLYTQRLILLPVQNLPEELQSQWRLDPQGLLAKWLNSESPPFQLDPALI